MKISMNRLFVEMAFTADKERSRLAKVLADPPALKDCVLEIRADDGTWHQREPADWLLTTLLLGFHVSRVRYPDDHEPERLG